MKKTVGLLLLVTMLCALFSMSVLAQNYQESPMLQERVESGELPPVEERLPDNPRVFEVTEEIGQYGGTLRMIHRWVGSSSQLNYLNKEFMLEATPLPTMDENELKPNVFESWEVNDDGTEFVLTIRKGLKWSDGVPVTTEDVEFAIEDVFKNKEISPVFPGWLKRDGQPVELEIIDDYTFKLKFATPYGIFPLRLNSHAYGDPSALIIPKHYMKQYHIDYASLEDMRSELEEEGLDDEWWQLFNTRNSGSGTATLTEESVGYPTLHPFIVVGKTSDNVTMLERNPYYFKVDREGNQLPYLDKIRMELVQDAEMASMKIISGEIDFEGGAGGLNLNNLPLYKENEDKGNYNTLVLEPTTINTPVNYFPNLTHDDDVWREIIQDVRFRKALSLAINRQEVNELIFMGMGEPTQATDVPGSPFRKEEFAKAYIEYNPERARELLDEMGLKDTDGDGWRERSDGETLTMPVEFFEVNPNVIPATELVVSYWKEIGIKTQMKVIDISLWAERQAANETVMSVWHEDGVRAGVPFMWYVPIDGFISYAPLWYQWYNTDGEEGAEPPAEIKKLYDLYETVVTTTSNEERIEAGTKILESQAENLWEIGTVGKVPAPMIFNKKLRNVPGWSICTQWGLGMVEQVYFAE